MNGLWKIENIGIGQCVIIARSPNRNGCPLGWGKGNLVCKVWFARSPLLHGNRGEGGGYSLIRG